MRRNEGRPFQGIDTMSIRFSEKPERIVEMQVTPFRPVTQFLIL